MHVSIGRKDAMMHPCCNTSMFGKTGVGRGSWVAGMMDSNIVRASKIRHEHMPVPSRGTAREYAGVNGIAM